MNGMSASQSITVPTAMAESESAGSNPARNFVGTGPSIGILWPPPQLGQRTLTVSQREYGALT
jgi:hypothetical protein